jgi:CRP-like cAMP-binding protein
MERTREHHIQVALSKTRLFEGCTRHELRTIAQNLTTVEVPAGRTLCHQGSPGRQFFVVVSGTATVTVDDEAISTIGPGGFFGEVALLDGGPRVATVTSDTEMLLLVGTSRELSAIIRDVPLVTTRMLTELCARLRDARYHDHVPAPTSGQTTTAPPTPPPPPAATAPTAAATGARGYAVHPN